MLSSANTFALNSAIIKRSSFHCKWAQLSVIKNAESPSCLTIAKNSWRNFFQYASVPFNVFAKRYASSFPTNDWTASVKLCYNILAVTVPVQTFLSTVLISLLNFSCCVTGNA